MEITFLGTSSMVPTKERNHSAVFMRYCGEGILFDCGEGTQRQIKRAGISPAEVTKMLVSHWHGDHVLGIPGLLQTLAGSDYEKELHIYGPKGTTAKMEHMFKAFVFDKRVGITIHEVRKEGLIFSNEKYEIIAKNLDHGVPCLGFLFKERDRRRMRMKELKKRGVPQGPLWGKLQRGKIITYKGKRIAPKEVTELIEGRKIAYVVDTRPCKSARELATHADLLICESTYGGELEEKGEKYSHMTAGQAAEVARSAEAKRLILTHFSQRYRTTRQLKEEAQKTFQSVECAYDFMKVKV